MQGLYYLAEKTAFEDTYGDDVIARFLGHGVQTALLGILTVFAVLSLLWGCLEIFKYVFYTIPERRKKADKKESASVSSAAPVPQVQPAQVYSDDKAVVAAIIAAITAAREEEGIPSTVPFRVVSFRKRK